MSTDADKRMSGLDRRLKQFREQRAEFHLPVRLYWLLVDRRSAAKTSIRGVRLGLQAGISVNAGPCKQGQINPGMLTFRVTWFSCRRAAVSFRHLW